jgi:hypothetical protein
MPARSTQSTQSRCLTCQSSTEPDRHWSASSPQVRQHAGRRRMPSHRGLEPGGRKTLIVTATLGQPGTAGTIRPNALRAGHNLVLALDRALAPRRAARFAS